MNKCFLDFDLETVVQTLLRQWEEKDQTKMIIPVMKRLSNSLKKWDDLNKTIQMNLLYDYLLIWRTSYQNM